MRILFVGGTRFVGRAIVEAALTAGHEASVLHRGSTRAEDLDGVEHLLADRDKDLSVLDGREFDATVDVCGYVPRQVEQLAAALDGRGGHHVFISTMSVYADTDAPGLTEDAPLTDPPSADVEEVTNETYGGLKVLCERAALAAYGAESLTVVRPTFVVGPNDYTFRFPRWVRRIAMGGEVLAPGPQGSPVQLIDARDQGAWVVRLAETATAGSFNGIGTGLPFGFEDMLAAIQRSVGPADSELTWVDGHWLVDQGVNGADLPLWAEGEHEWTLAGSNVRALQTGLSPRPLEETVADTLEWLQRTGAEPASGWGLAPEREAELLAAWHSGS